MQTRETINPATERNGPQQPAEAPGTVFSSENLPDRRRVRDILESYAHDLGFTTRLSAEEEQRFAHAYRNWVTGEHEKVLLQPLLLFEVSAALLSNDAVVGAEKYQAQLRRAARSTMKANQRASAGLSTDDHFIVQLKSNAVLLSSLLERPHLKEILPESMIERVQGAVAARFRAVEPGISAVQPILEKARVSEEFFLRAARHFCSSADFRTAFFNERSETISRAEFAQLLRVARAMRQTESDFVVPYPIFRELARDIDRPIPPEARAARDKLAESMLRFVFRLAKDRGGSNFDTMDLIGEGNLAALASLKRFRPELGFRLATFIGLRTKGALTEYVTREYRERPLSLYAARLEEIYRDAQRFFAHRGVDAPTSEDYAKHLGIDTAEVSFHRRVLKEQSTLTPLHSVADDALSGCAVSRADEALQQKDLSRKLARVMDLVLDPQEKRILCLRFGLSGESPHTAEEVAEIVGFSFAGSVSKNVQRSLQRMQNALIVELYDQGQIARAMQMALYASERSVIAERLKKVPTPLEQIRVEYDRGGEIRPNESDASAFGQYLRNLLNLQNRGIEKLAEFLRRAYGEREIADLLGA